MQHCCCHILHSLQRILSYFAFSHHLPSPSFASPCFSFLVCWPFGLPDANHFDYYMNACSIIIYCFEPHYFWSPAMTHTHTERDRDNQIFRRRCLNVSVIHLFVHEKHLKWNDIIISMFPSILLFRPFHCGHLSRSTVCVFENWWQNVNEKEENGIKSIYSYAQSQRQF